jgi:hypothetical protein
MKAKKLLFSLILLAGLLLIGLAVLETAVRLFFRAEILGSKMPLIYQYHEALGHTYKPGAVGYMSRHGEIFSRIEINAAGFRDYGYAEKKPGGVFRIAVVGDSFVTGNQVPLEKILPKVLEKKLRREAGTGVEVLNFGVDGYGPREQRLLYDLRIKAYGPDLVIQCVFPFNDVNDVMQGRVYRTEYRGAVLKYRSDAERDRQKAERDRELAGKGPAASRLSIGGALRDKLWLIRLIEGRRLRSSPGPPADVRQLNEWRIPQIDRAPEYVSHAFARSLGVTKSLILDFSEEVLASGGRFVLVIIPADLEVALSEWETRPYVISPELFKKAMHRGCALFEAFAAEQGLPALNLLPAFRAARGEKKLYWTYDAHWTEAGHELAAACLSDFLLDNHLIDKPG